jgi:hypothetical protein
LKKVGSLSRQSSAQFLLLLRMTAKLSMRVESLRCSGTSCSYSRSWSCLFVSLIIYIWLLIKFSYCEAADLILRSKKQYA